MVYFLSKISLPIKIKAIAPIVDVMIDPIQPELENPIIPKSQPPTKPPTIPKMIFFRTAEDLDFIITPANHPATAPINIEIIMFICTSFRYYSTKIIF